MNAGDLSAGLLLSAGLASLTDAAEADVRVRYIRPQDAFNFVLSCASGGGAYGGELYGAYGRLAAWRSLAGLTRSPEGQHVEEVAAAVERCAWASFETDQGWFHRIAWDLGMVAITPEGMSLAVLAATDTD